MKSKLLFFVLGLILAFLLTTTIRFFAYSENHTHFHANFLMYINGKKLNFSDPKYMEEISSCAETDTVLPKQRAHMHENNGETVHIHQPGVTWGHFLLNIGYNIGSDYLVDDKNATYKSDSKNKLTFVLNGKQVRNIANELIKSEDKLLINYGSESIDDLINQRSKEIAETARDFNLKNDPAACSGHGELSFGEKLKKAIFN